MNARNPGRHRASRRPITPLTPIARAAQEGTINAARRGAVIAAGSGLLVSVFAAPASAAPTTEQPKSVSSVDLSALTAPAREALRAAPVVTVSADAAFTIEQAPVAVTPAPEPEPEPEPEREDLSTSRSQERTSQGDTAQTAVEAPPSAAGSSVVSVAMRYLGVPYLWGGTTPDGFDCSGFTSYVYAQVGIDLPRTSSEQRYAGTVVSRDQAQPGDLVWSPGHIGIYAGGGMQVEAPSPGKTVRYVEIWQTDPVFIRIG